MKRFLAVATLATLTVAGPAFAAPATKIGTVDLQRAVTECKEGTTLRAELLKRTEQLNTELKGLLAQVEKGKGELEKGATKLSAKEREEKEQELKKKAREFQNRQREAQEELKQTESDYLKKLLAKFGTILVKLGDDEKYTAILDRNNGVYYAGKQADVTPLLVERADTEFEKR